MGDVTNKTVKHTFVYGLGTIIRRAVSLVMLPIYTRFLTPADYGVIELLTMLLDLTGIVLCNRIGEAVFRYYATSDTIKEKNQVIFSALGLSVTINTLGCLLIILFSTHLAMLVFSDLNYQHLIVLFSLILITESFVAVPLVFIRAQERPWLFLIASSLLLCLQVGFNLYFVVYKELHVEGVIYSNLLSSSITGLVLLTYTFKHVGISFSFKYTKELFQFSLPIAFATLGSFYLTFGDRYFIKLYNSIDDVGIYSLAYKFGFILVILAWDPFSKIWDSQRYSVYKETNAVTSFQKIFLNVNIFVILIALCIGLFVKELLIVMSEKSFWPAYEIVPYVLIAYIIWIWTNYCNFGLLIYKKTIHIAMGELVGVLVITIAYLTLIPAYGSIGAAVATIIGFLARFLWINYKSMKLYSMHLPWMQVIKMLAIAIMLYIATNYMPLGFIMLILMKGAMVILFLSIVFYSGFIKGADRNDIYSILKSVRARIS